MATPSTPNPLARARSIASERRGRTKVEDAYDGSRAPSTRVRYVGRERRGGQRRLDLDRIALDLVLREVVAGRDELLRADARLEASDTAEAWRARRDALAKLRRASELLAEAAQAGGREGEPATGIELRPATLATAAAAAAGQLVYLAHERSGGRELLAELRSRLALRGLELRGEGAGYWRVAGRDVLPVESVCSCCGGQVQRRRCTRCGTRWEPLA